MKTRKITGRIALLTMAILLLLTTLVGCAMNNLQVPQREGTTHRLATYAVGRHLKAVLQECHRPTYEYDGNNAIALQLRLKGYMTIPREGHKDI